MEARQALSKPTATRECNTLLLSDQGVSALVTDMPRAAMRRSGDNAGGSQTSTARAETSQQTLSLSCPDWLHTAAPIQRGRPMNPLRLTPPLSDG